MAAPALASPLSIRFDPEKHHYYVGGVRWPSVTQVLEAAGFSDYSSVPRDVLENAQRRGAYVHKACWYDDMGVLDPATLDPAIAGYLEAWRAWRRNTGFKPQKIEDLVACPVYRYCGQYDRFGYFPDGSAGLPDIKTGAPCPSWRYQLAGYARLHPDPLRIRRINVKLNDDGTYDKPYEWPVRDYREDESIFLASVICWWGKLKHRLLPD